MKKPDANRRTFGPGTDPAQDTRATRSRRKRGAALAWLCALAICFQCIIVQSHIHNAASRLAELQRASSTAGAIIVRQETAPARKQAPAGGSPSDCFICQQMTLAGAAILPPSPVPVFVQHELDLELATVTVAAVASQPSHIWRSRAPPISLRL